MYRDTGSRVRTRAGRSLIGLFWLQCLRRVGSSLSIRPYSIVVHTEVSEGLDILFSEDMDPNDAVLDLDFADRRRAASLRCGKTVHQKGIA